MSVAALISVHPASSQGAPSSPSATKSASTASIAALIEQARTGAASLDEVGHAFIENALKGEELPLQPSQFPDELPGIDDVLAPLVKKAIDGQLPQQKVVRLVRLRELVPVLDETTRKTYLKIFELCEKADSLVEAADTAAMESLINSAGADAKRFLEQRMISLHILERVSLPGTTPPRALELLATMPTCGKTQRTKAVVEEVVGKLSGALTAEADSVLSSAAVQQILREAIEGSPTMRAKLADIYDKQVRLMVERAAAERLPDTFRMLVELRPDPNPENTKLRMFAATHTGTTELRYFAVSRVDELRLSGDLSMGKKLRLIYSGYYGIILPVFVTIIIVLFAGGAGAFVFFYFQFRKRENAISADEHKFQKEHAETISKLKGGSRGTKSPPRGSGFSGRKPRGYVRELHGEDEYSRLLSFFGLDDSATESDIKKAYRDKVKNYHPDTAGKDESTSEEERTQFFIQAKETYDRILEIRGSWFGANKS